MLTRRTAIGAGIAFASLSSATGVSLLRPLSQRRREARSIDALFVDETVDMPSGVAAFLKGHGPTLPVVGLRLDAATHAGLRRILDQSSVIAGISSGASLFCLERIAWDHGFRLTERGEHCAGSLDDDAAPQSLVAVLGGTNPTGVGISAVDRAYRPSRADGTLHIWSMQTTARRHSLQACREEAL
jgi:hypothetical protein